MIIVMINCSVLAVNVWAMFLVRHKNTAKINSLDYNFESIKQRMKKKKTA